MSTDHEISVLNGLIKTTLDSMKGFDDAAKDAGTTRFKTIFEEFARDRSEVATKLQTEVRALGAEPEEHSSFMAAAHRAFMDLKQAMAGKNDKAIVEEVERGEDYIVGKFESALEDQELSSPTARVIREAYASVRAGHERARALKQSAGSD
jgi:uncharacterized protein (TIGR02284 family)